MMDMARMRGGVGRCRRADRIISARRTRTTDNAGKSVQWERIPRRQAWGRPNVVHMFERQRAGQHRGGAGILTPVLQRLKMLIKYDGTELDSRSSTQFSRHVESHTITR
jgi:hypothetical protein